LTEVADARCCGGGICRNREVLDKQKEDKDRTRACGAATFVAAFERVRVTPLLSVGVMGFLFEA
jgi:translation elongation factor EF-4